MRFLQSFDVTLNIQDPVQFETSRQEHTLLQLRDTFQGRCYKGVFILEVQACTRISRCLLNPVGTIGTGAVNATFTALCARYHVGDALPAMKVLQRGKILTGVSSVTPGVDQPEITLTITPSHETISEGQLVPVRLTHIRYPPTQVSPVAAAQILTCRTECTYWEVTDDDNGEAQGLATALLPELEEALARKGRLSPNLRKVRSFFEKLLLTFKDPKDVPGGWVKSELTAEPRVSEWVSALKPGTVWVQPLEMPYDWAGVCRVPAGQLPAGVKALPVSAKVVVNNVLNAVTNTTQVLNGFATLFEEEARIRSHMNIWKIMNDSRLP